MKTVTLSPETPQSDPKDVRRDDFARRYRKQDHGTGRGMKYRSDKLGVPTSAEERANAFLSAELAASFDPAFGKVSAKQLKGAADQILKAAGFTDHEPEIFAQPSAEEEADTTTYRRVEAEMSDEDLDTALQSSRVSTLYDRTAADEILTAYRLYGAVHAHPDRQYHGRADEDDLGDYLGGMHLTDRP